MDQTHTPIKHNESTTQTAETDRLLMIFKALQAVDPEFPIQYVICLIEIAHDPGMSLTTLSQKTNMPLSTISRIVGALSDHRQKGRPFHLVEVTFAEGERRKKQLQLSQKGKTFIENLTLKIS